VKPRRARQPLQPRCGVRQRPAVPIRKRGQQRSHRCDLRRKPSLRCDCFLYLRSAVDCRTARTHRGSQARCSGAHNRGGRGSVMRSAGPSGRQAGSHRHSDRSTSRRARRGLVTDRHARFSWSPLCAILCGCGGGDGSHRARALGFRGGCCGAARWRRGVQIRKPIDVRVSGHDATAGQITIAAGTRWGSAAGRAAIAAAARWDVVCRSCTPGRCTSRHGA